MIDLIYLCIYDHFVKLHVHVCSCKTRIKLPTLALKPTGDVTRSPKQGYQWPNKMDLCPPKITKILYPKRICISGTATSALEDPDRSLLLEEVLCAGSLPPGTTHPEELSNNRKFKVIKQHNVKVICLY